MIRPVTRPGIANSADAVAQALEAFADLRTVEGAADAFSTVERLRADLPPGRGQLHILEVACSSVRRVLGELPAADWPSALTLVDTLLAFCERVTTSTRLSLSGRPDHDHIREMLQRSLEQIGKPEFEEHSDAELIFGFLAVDASRSWLSRREMPLWGVHLAEVIRDRLMGATDEDGAAEEPESTELEESAADAPSAEITAPSAPNLEVVHWSIALLDRVHRGQAQAHYVGLAGALLGLMKPADAGHALRGYVERTPEMAGVLLARTNPADYLQGDELASVVGVAFGLVVDEAVGVHEPSPAVTFCERLRLCGIRLSAEEVASHISARLRALVQDLQTQNARPLTVHTEALLRAFTPIVTEGALPLIREALGLAPLDPDAHRRKYGDWWGMTPGRFVIPVEALVERRPVLVFLIAFLVTAFLTVNGLMLLTGISETVSTLSISVPRVSAAPATAFVRPSPPQQIFSRTDSLAASITDSGIAAARLDQARTAAEAGDLATLISDLSADSVGRGLPEAFAWDSLLASAAFQQANQLQRDDMRRPALLSLTRDRVGRALASPTANEHARDYLRVIRAEACLSSQIQCDDRVVLMDLAFASESSNPELRTRAVAILNRAWESRMLR